MLVIHIKMHRLFTPKILYKNVNHNILNTVCSNNRSVMIGSCRTGIMKYSEISLQNFCPNRTVLSLFSVFTNHLYFSTETSNTLLKEKSEKKSGSISHDLIENAWKLKKCLCCNLKESQSFIKENKCLSNFSISDILERCMNCVSNNISKDFILKNGWILSFTIEELNERLKILKSWNFLDYNSGLYLLKLDVKDLHNFTNVTIKEAAVEPELKNSNRLTYLSKILQVDESSVVELSVKRKFILKTDFTRLKDTILLVLSYGMSPGRVFKDMWIVKYSLKEIKRRLDILSLSIEPDELRPWMLHCKKSVFMRTIELRDENRSALEPFASAEEYLSNRLRVDVNVIETLKQKHPPLQQVQVYKLKEILDFLFSEGFTPAQACRAPRVFCHSLSTLKERLNILRNVGYKPTSLMTLCKTQKQFKEFIGKLGHTGKFQKMINR